MKRMKVLFGNRRMMVLLTLAILVLAAAALIASSASFTSTSANVGNVFTAGTLTHTNDATALLDISGTLLKPDDAWVSMGSVTLTNDGDIDGQFWFTTSDIGNTPGANGGNLSDALQLRVMRGATTVYSGDINAVPAVAPLSDAGTIAAGASATYTVEVMFPDGGTPTTATTEDNAYQGSAMTIDLDWECVNL